MPKASNVIPLRQKLPKTAAQADRLKKLARSKEPVDVEITILPDRDHSRKQRTWRLLFGLYQDTACVRWSKGFKKRPGVPFVGKMHPSQLPLFVKEAMPLVVNHRAEIRIEGSRLRRRLMDVMAV